MITQILDLIRERLGGRTFDFFDQSEKETFKSNVESQKEVQKYLLNPFAGLRL
jgi:hypothetical protein